MKINLHKKRKLGEFGPFVSPLCLGTMMFGGRTNELESEKIIDSARKNQINFIDTADVYNEGKSEKIIGKYIKRDRENWILASKVGSQFKNKINFSGLGKQWMLKSIDNSLLRLNTDYLDIWYLHLPDPKTPLEKTVETLGEIIEKGKIKNWGFSNFRGWQISNMISIAKEMNIKKPVVSQPYYNAMNRIPEIEILPACEYFKIGVASYSPIARGILSGKYQTNKEPPSDSRLASQDKRMLETEFRKESIIISQKLIKYCSTKDISILDFAILWVLNNSLITSIIGGPRTVYQWENYCSVFDKEFKKEYENLLNSLVSPGHPSTPGFNDPKYPITGRPLINDYL